MDQFIQLFQDTFGGLLAHWKEGIGLLVLIFIVITMLNEMGPGPKQ